MDIQLFWEKLGRGARAGLLASLFAIVAATVALGYWMLRTDYQVLFSDLAPQDAAAMASELDRLKMPYKLGEDGASILVDKDQVYKTRMKLMGKELPLRGAVGFELFNNSDFGMTEFAQKINFQRALQGELTRTILSLTQIKDARVILVMPEQGLFKQSTSKAKASITVAMKPGQTLRAEQVTGIQRLVAASVPGIATQDVTILDQSGVALSRDAGFDSEGDVGTGRLDLKKETENYLSRKAGEVLERTFGPGQAMVTVDVVLNTDRAQVTIDDLVVPPGRSGHAPTGVVVRERETVRDTGAPLEAKTNDGSTAVRAGSSQRDVEYAVGHRVEQIVSHPGSIRRLQAVVVVRRALSPAQQEQIRRVLAAAVGASFERGDTVVVHTLDMVTAAGSLMASDAQAAVEEKPVELAKQTRSDRRVTHNSDADFESWQAIAFIAALGAVALGLFFMRRRRESAAVRAVAPLTPDQRHAALVKVRAWMAEDAAPPAVEEGR